MARQRSLRNKSATTKLTETEYLQLQVQADVAQINLSEWIRGRLLETERIASESSVLLAEVLALRTILLNLLLSIANGKQLTAEQMQILIERADSGKAAKAQTILMAGRAVASPAKQGNKETE